MKRKTSLSFFCLLALLVSLALSPTVFAQSQQGSLLIQNIEFSVNLYVVADENGVFTEDFTGFSAQPLTSSTPLAKTAKALASYIQTEKLSGQEKAPDENAQVYFPHLEPCWYLICSAVSDTEFAPFLVQLPTQIGDKTVYHLQATPKKDRPSTEETESTEPQAPEDSIPQTGFVQWPKYLLLGLGALFIIVGFAEVIRGQRKHYE